MNFSMAIILYPIAKSNSYLIFNTIQEVTLMKFYDMTTPKKPENVENKRAHIIGSGIAGLAAAVYLVQDAGMPGKNITIYESRPNLGGCLEAFGNAEEGYLSTGAREPEPYFQCMWELCRRIPSLEELGKTILDETVEFNKKYPIYCNTRFLEKQGKVDETQHQMELDPANGMKLMQLLMTPDKDLENVSLADWFDADYFESNMWKDFSTKLAFQKWDSAMEMKQYIHRFLHLGEGSELHKGILHFKYNEYDSLAKPIIVFLEKQGVSFKASTEVTDISLKDEDGKTSVTALTIKQNGSSETITLGADDYVFLTSGSMIQNTTYGDNRTVAEVNNDKEHRGCFTLWEKLAAHDAKFGHPEKFISATDKTQWISFSLTIRDYPELLATIEKLTSDYDGCAGLMTFKDSSWCLSTYVQHQPFYPDQPENVQFIWNYGLHPWNTGDYIKKPMNECIGEEILSEMLYHLGLADKIAEILPHCTVRTAMMPYITSQFMPRQAGDRPNVIPDGCTNLALMGQYLETGDVVFTVETSIRSAMMAVYGLFDLGRPVIPVAPTKFDIRVISSMIRYATGNGETLPEDLSPLTGSQLKEMLRTIPAFAEDI